MRTLKYLDNIQHDMDYVGQNIEVKHNFNGLTEMQVVADFMSTELITACVPDCGLLSFDTKNGTFGHCTNDNLLTCWTQGKKDHVNSVQLRLLDIAI